MYNILIYKNMKNKLKAFTLIELLVVIAIIGILAAVVYAPFQKARAKGRDAKKVAEMKSIQTALSLYADSNGGYYPTTLSALASATGFKLPALVNTTSSFDPNKYNYTSYGLNGNPVSYHLYTHLETASPALDGAAKCRGAGNSATACLNTSQTATTSGVSEPSSGNTAKFLQTERGTDDNDTYCAADTTGCYLDLIP